MLDIASIAREEIKRRKFMSGRKEAAEESLYEFMKMFWHCVEPEKEFVEGWALEAICLHLEAVASGEIKRLIINVPPGFSKSLSTDVFFPAWLWISNPSYRFICTSSQAYLTERDNMRFMRVVSDPLYQQLWGDRFKLDLVGVSNITNNKTGFKLASTTSGLTGSRGNFVIIDDPNSTDPRRNESDVQREGINNWLMEVMPDRLNSVADDCIILIQQRTHESDATATLLDRGQDYCHLMIPMEYDPMRHCETDIGWSDPRTEPGELAWPDRFSREVVEKMKIEKGPYAYAGQYLQSPTVRGGNIIDRDWWQVYDLDYALRLGLVPEGGKTLVYPPFDLVVVSVDTALTSKKENCYSGCVVMGVWKDEKNLTKIMLIYAWQRRLQLHGVSPTSDDTEEQKKAKEGLVEAIARTASPLPLGVTPRGANAILIENKANGPDVINEFARLYRNRNWQLIPIDPKGDKVARAHATVPTFTQGLIYAPDKAWAQLVIDQCLVGETLVYTAMGIKRIDEVIVGDLVLTHKGRFRPVLATSCRMAEKIIELKPKTLDVMRVTEEHPIYAGYFTAKRDFVSLGWVAAGKMVSRLYRKVARSPIGVEAAESPAHTCTVVPPIAENPINEIDLRDWISAPKRVDSDLITLDEFAGSSHWKAKSIKWKQPLDYRFGRVVGLYLAEGSGDRLQRHWSFNKKTEQHLIKEISSYFDERWGLNSSVYHQNNCSTVSVCIPLADDFFKEMGHRAPNKRIPSWVWNAPDEFLQGIVSGYAEGDGCEYKGYYAATTVSSSLAWGIRLMLARLGIFCNVTLGKKPGEILICGRKATCLQAYIMRWFKEVDRRYYAGVLHDGVFHYPVMEKQTIDKPEGVSVYNMHVYEDNSYFTTSGVVHNCATFPRGKDKDLVDALTQCVLYLRAAGIIMRPDEEAEEIAARNMIVGDDDDGGNIYGA